MPNANERQQAVDDLRQDLKRVETATVILADDTEWDGLSLVQLHEFRAGCKALLLLFRQAGINVGPRL